MRGTYINIQHKYFSFNDFFIFYRKFYRKIHFGRKKKQFFPCSILHTLLNFVLRGYERT